jgi:hypothetical protein
MSERGGGSGVPGVPQRIAGIPSNARNFDLSQFLTVNRQRPRASISDQEMAWAENLMPIGPNYLRALPDRSVNPIYTAPGLKFRRSGNPAASPPSVSGPALVDFTPGPT